MKKEPIISSGTAETMTNIIEYEMAKLEELELLNVLKRLSNTPE